VWKWENSQDAVKAYTALLGFLALGQIPALRHVRFVDLPYFIGLASMTIYIGAHRGLCTKVRQQISIKEVQSVQLFSFSITESRLVEKD
jgi:minor histocompatibility antigen H13